MNGFQNQQRGAVKPSAFCSVPMGLLSHLQTKTSTEAMTCLESVLNLPHQPRTLYPNVLIRSEFTGVFACAVAGYSVGSVSLLSRSLPAAWEGRP